MSIVKSLSVGEGDMFYIKHDTDNFSIIDCCLSDNKNIIIQEIKKGSSGKYILRFISTHPDNDHICGLESLDDEIKILNFYCVKNNASKEDETEDFDRYCQLRDSKKAFYLFKGCSRKWMNISDTERGGAGIEILWPVTTNKYYIEALEKAENGESPNNISIIVSYKLANGALMLWLGDLEKDFMENIKNEIALPKVNVLFASHHGRKTGKIPKEWLEQMNPDIIVIGEAPSENLDYESYDDYNKITQNSAGDIVFECCESKTHIYVSKEGYSVDFLDNDYMNSFPNYIGTLNL